MTKKIHFIGIGGSGCAGCAMMAHNAGYEVSGCDKNLETSYLKQVKEIKNIKLFNEHNKDHIKDADIVASSPALFSKDIEEVNLAKEQGKLMKWQHFLGDFILNNKKVVGVCGTHGKTTTTTMLGLCLENAGMDPNVFVGGVVPSWEKTIRIGKSDLFVIEADEYDSNFIKYAPDIVILNNAEMEHPEIFKNEEEYMKIFVNFLETMPDKGKIILNLDDKGCLQLIEHAKEYIIDHEIELYGITTTGESNMHCKEVFDSLVIDNKNGKRTFEIDGSLINLNVAGTHNVTNATMSFVACKILGADINKVIETLESFSPPKRRMEIIKESEKGSLLINDYAHHHTQVQKTLEAARELNKNNTLIAIFEAHQISRLENHMDEYATALSIADIVYITPVFVGREAGKTLPDIDKFKNMIEANKVHFLNKQPKEFAIDIVNDMKNHDNEKTIIVMGAGKSEQIVNEIKDHKELF